MAGELLSLGVQKLCVLLSQEIAHFQGVVDQVAVLKRDLNLLNADAKKHTSPEVKTCLEDIKEIICDAEDIIETFFLREKFGKTSGVRKRIRRLACVIPDRRKIALDIRGLDKRISKMIKNMQSYGVQETIADSRYVQPLHDRKREKRQEFPRENESDLVGLKANVDRLLSYLVEEDNVQVVSMTGMGGLGKTTLARQAFNHEMVKKKFDKLAWVCVTQVCDRMNVWQAILQNFKPKEEQQKIMDMKETALHEELFQLLKTSKSLIVFDDIWKEEDWDVIRKIFPPEKGWKVLITSRNENVARCGNTSFINFKPACLTNEKSWTLFQRVAMPRKDASELEVEMEETEERIKMEKMEKMGKQMIEHCKGLPLAIRVLGGLLGENYTLHNWERVSKNIGSHLVGRNDVNDHNKNSLNYVLSLSFEELPSYLKNCFLYLAHFPEDYEIDIENLSYCWAAEGIIRYNDGESIRDVGDTFIEELVRRNMVISKRDITTERFETCQLHDLMREICLSKAKEENFVQFVGINSETTHSQSLSTSRRFVSHYPTKLHVEREINNLKVRSIVIIKNESYSWKLSGLSFTRLQLLRVLHLYSAEFKGGKLPKSIGKLIHLRYLNLEKAWVCHLPSSLKNLKLLIYLNLDVLEPSCIFVPNVLMGMKELRYLALPRDMHKKTKLELSNLKKLETLKNFSAENSSFRGSP
ncbi:unnamed protein product [Thlaspi arvense]|uniref:Disease resistance protein n=1 Tax=Thlaspi arvense TaxID=13288 RepID=A0AAU9RPP7_THLAR|nr:unnamed protein product [Thlaspi arvense]